ncbi:MAG: dephospho-CoA kinase [Flavobacteriales bacterium]|nr:dephospho-CoA kinase [Flavobacteriales bacterium]
MHKVGITGGIGSGKSTICKVFLQLGVPVYNADTRGKELLRINNAVKEQVIAVFGTETYLEDGSVNRNFLSQRVFTDPAALEKLNGIVHPAVRLDFEEWVGQQESSYVLKEAAILVETGAYKELDTLIVVEADVDSRVKRVMERDQVGENKVLERVKAQITDEKRRTHADHIIDNNDDQLVIPQILAIHEDIISRTSS